MQALWAEIRRRNLHRVTAGYAVVAWVLFQGAGIAFPAFHMPDWALQLLVILLIAGLPVLWVGLWLAHPSAELAPTTRAPLHHTEWVLIGLLGLVLIATIAEFGYSQFKPSITARAPAVGPQEASIAVLAFNNMSDDPKNEYFSDGISEDLLNDLAKVPGLRVAARTSSFSFKGKSVTVGDIAKILNVRTVLEGSVQREANRVRIVAQLINAADGYHMWSETYDRELADIFAVQDEISHAITKELIGRLLGKEAQPTQLAAPITAPARISPDAYTAYLQGRFFMNKRNKDDMWRAVDFFKQAIKLEPNYADAHASLGITYGLLFANGQARDTAELANEETKTALRLDPNNPFAIIAKAGAVASTWKWADGDAAFRKALAIYPNSPITLHPYSTFLMFLDLNDLALQAERHAEALDPLSPIVKENMGDILSDLGRNEEAIAAYKASLTLDPNLIFSLVGLCENYVGLKRIDDANVILREHIIPIDGNDGPYATLCKSMIAYGTDDKSETNKLGPIMVQHYSQGASATFVAMTYAFTGDYTSALQWFSKAYDERDTQFLFERLDPFLPLKLTSDPRWKELLRRPAFRDMAPVRAAILARGAGG